MAETLLFLIDENSEKAIKKAEDILESFPEKFDHYWVSNILAKLGIKKFEETDQALFSSLFSMMEDQGSDFTNTFRLLPYVLKDTIGNNRIWCKASHPNSKNNSDGLKWLKSWRKRVTSQNLTHKEIVVSLKSTNPSLIPRNHLVEKAIVNAVHENDFSFFNLICEEIKTPFLDRKLLNPNTQPPKQHEVIEKTFCGT